MGKITIYRVTALGDTLASILAGGTDFIQFNVDKNSRNANPYITRYTKGGQTGIGENQSPGQPTSNLQPLDKIEDLYTFYGFISKLNDLSGMNVYANQLVLWDNDPQKVNASWPQGRFGVSFDDFHALDVIPANKNSNNQIGLIWQNLVWDNDFATKPIMGKFTLSMKISRSNGT